VRSAARLNARRLGSLSAFWLLTLAFRAFSPDWIGPQHILAAYWLAALAIYIVRRTERLVRGVVDEPLRREKLGRYFPPQVAEHIEKLSGEALELRTRNAVGREFTFRVPLERPNELCFFRAGQVSDRDRRAIETDRNVDSRVGPRQVRELPRDGSPATRERDQQVAFGLAFRDEAEVAQRDAEIVRDLLSLSTRYLVLPVPEINPCVRMIAGGYEEAHDPKRDHADGPVH
jgi:hypothetical protein